MTTNETNWFSDGLPYDYKARADGRINVWHMKAFQFDGETDLKWYVAAVVDSAREAKEFIATAAK